MCAISVAQGQPTTAGDPGRAVHGVRQRDAGEPARRHGRRRRMHVCHDGFSSAEERTGDGDCRAGAGCELS
jgi:hypothetical protein